MPWLPLLHELKIVCDVAMVTTMKTIPSNSWSRLKIVHTIHNFEDRGLEFIALRSPWIASHATKSHEILAVGSEVDRGQTGGQTHRQDADLINLFTFLESRLKITPVTLNLLPFFKNVRGVYQVPFGYEYYKWGGGARQPLHFLVCCASPATLFHQ
jgi:hypothetical protein